MASSVMNFPEGQLVQVGEAVDEYFPEEQTIQAVAVIETSVFFPASQSMQAVRSAWRGALAASSAMYVPEGQLVQVGEAV